MNSGENQQDSDVQSFGNDAPTSNSGWFRRSFNPFRIATLRGLGLVLPPLLTIIFFFWAWNTVERAVLRPVEAIARHLIVWSVGDIRDGEEVANIRREDPDRFKVMDGQEVYVDEKGEALVEVSGNWIPADVYQHVLDQQLEKPPVTARETYHTYAQTRFLKRHLVIPAFLAAFVALLYLIGKLLAAGVGRIMWRALESMINRVPIIRNVYSSVKQVTDFAFNEKEIEFNRVVAVEYPRKGIWSMGFVTGESLRDIRDAAGEPMLSVLMPTSPMPATGFTISIPKSETVDLDITIDQAIQFCVSCGVVIPDHQQTKSTVDGEVRSRFRKLTQTDSNYGSSDYPNNELSNDE